MIWVRWETVYILVLLLPPIHPCSVKKATPVCLNSQPPSVSECVVFSIYIAEAGLSVSTGPYSVWSLDSGECETDKSDCYPWPAPGSLLWCRYDCQVT